jgi:gluconate 2-dehydrogenase gamma chain
MSKLSRREFVVQSTLYGGALWMLLNARRPRALQAALETSYREAFSEEQWMTVQAITGRIIPTDHEPGAIEANAVNFIDKALVHEDRKLKPVYDQGLAGLDLVSKHRFSKPFVALAPEQQDDVLAALESGKAEGWPSSVVPAAEFFAIVRMHSIVGFLADPKYGGNRDYAGWKVVGYPGGGHHQGGFSAAQMMGKDTVKTAWGEEV